MYEIDDDDVDTGCDDEAYRDQQFLRGVDPGDESDGDNRRNGGIYCDEGLHCEACIMENQAYCCDCGAPLEPSE